MAALAVDQHQKVVRGQAPEGGGAHQGGFVVDAVALDVVGWHQGAQDIVHIDIGLGAQLFPIQYVHGRGRFFHRARRMPRPYDHEFFEYVNGVAVGLPVVGILFLRGGLFHRLLGPRPRPDEK